LTTREREVLDHLVAGRTYAEIAAALFVSEKTVSTHVSNLLRKSGTRSRLEVSALALRLRDEEQQPGGAGPLT
jgi:DNA-binding NarL/FixJ family response regulator